VSFVGWGNVGGAGAIEQLWLVAAEVRDGPAEACCAHLARSHGATRQAVKPTKVLDDELRPRLDLLTQDLLWWIVVLAAGRSTRQTGER
jgi:hypothetical protein